ncbi:DUF58 domain-containing protein [Roseovarius aestuariivivens]|uniref:DUF58 domain-containing protein n=1 Tax=Roseovarius aestuariivivens TaxID=1888910 RepID=UPI001FD992CB|nr:DUF58 domain-containing protein [Roseovarius aestuariivivens]
MALEAGALIALRQIALSFRTDPVLAALPGGFATRRKGQGLEVADTRAYVHGDDFRRLDFGTTARTGILHVREFQQEQDRITLLVADFRPAMLWGIRRAFRSVAAAETLAILGWNVVEQGGRVALLAVLPDDVLVVPARGRSRGMLDVIGGLVEAHSRALQQVFEGGSKTRFLDSALIRVERIVPGGSEVVIASSFDHPGDGLADRLNEIARRRAPYLISVVDTVEAALPKGRYPIRLLDGTRKTIRRRRVSSKHAQPDSPIDGWPVLQVDAGQSIETTAARVAATFPQSYLK